MSNIDHQGKVVDLFKRTTGLDIRTPPELLEPGALTSAFNVDVLKTGGLVRRYGYRKLRDLVKPHSLWADNNACFVVSEGVLYQVSYDLLVQEVRSGLASSAQMYYTRVGHLTYYSNGTDCGIVDTGAHRDWQFAIPVGGPSDAVYEFPVQGRYLTAYNGRLYCAVDKFLHFTEYMALGASRRSRNIAQMPNVINFIVASEDVLWVGNSETIVALQGGGIAEFKFSPVCDYPAMENTVAKVPTGYYKPGTWWFCNTPEGICVLGPGGAFENLTNLSVALPGTVGSGAVFPSGKYVTTFE